MHSAVRHCMIWYGIMSAASSSSTARGGCWSFRNKKHPGRWDVLCTQLARARVSTHLRIYCLSACLLSIYLSPCLTNLTYLIKLIWPLYLSDLFRMYDPVCQRTASAQKSQVIRSAVRVTRSGLRTCNPSQERSHQTSQDWAKARNPNLVATYKGYLNNQRGYFPPSTGNALDREKWPKPEILHFWGAIFWPGICGRPSRATKQQNTVICDVSAFWGLGIFWLTVAGSLGESEVRLQDFLMLYMLCRAMLCRAMQMT